MVSRSTAADSARSSLLQVDKPPISEIANCFGTGVGITLRVGMHTKPHRSGSPLPQLAGGEGEPQERAVKPRLESTSAVHVGLPLAPL